MKVPLSWLKQYVDIDASPEDVAHRLTFSGIELEGMETIGGDVEGIVVAEVREVEKHPNADKLSVCKVFDGNEEVQVVCGAPNVTAGGKYPFARIGAALDGGSFKIKKAKLRGVESFGMLCSTSELKLPGDASGLMVLPEDAEPGTPMADLLPEPDVVFELEITPNRPDCLSLIGIARELAALYGTSLKMPEVETAETGNDVNDEVNVVVENAEDCPRYTARVLRNVKIGPSPDWMASRLEKSGIRPINNVVDITNYVLLETGHPLHAFDQRLVEGGTINVRRVRDGEKLTTLDEIERELDSNMLVIADENKPIALAGVMGGAGSEIQDDTTSVLLESATFNPAPVRYASRKLMLFTDSSYRFERGVNAETVDWASQRAAQLMIELAGAELDKGIVDVRVPTAELRTIELRLGRVRTLLGTDISNDRIAELLQSIELETVMPTDNTLEVIIPSFRFDLEREVDLIEEVARLHGLDNIPPVFSKAAPNPDADDTAVRQVRALRDNLINLGLQEIVAYSLVSEQLLDLFDKSDKEQRVVLPRPVTTDQAILRTSLAPQLVETLGRNRSRQIAHAGLFEIGKVYKQDADENYTETLRLGIGLMGRPQIGSVYDRKAPSAEEMFSWIKGLWEQIASRYRINDWSLADDAQQIFESGFGFNLHVDGKPVGRVGIVAAAIRKEWRLNDPVAILEIDAGVVAHRKREQISYAPVPSYPHVERDMALVADASLRHEDIVAAIKKFAPDELEAIHLFDIFTGEAVGDGKRSLAYSLTYRSSVRTLTDDEVNGYHNTVKGALKKELSVEIRES